MEFGYFQWDLFCSGGGEGEIEVNFFSGRLTFLGGVHGYIFSGSEILQED